VNLPRLGSPPHRVRKPTCDHLELGNPQGLIVGMGSLREPGAFRR